MLTSLNEHFAKEHYVPQLSRQMNNESCGPNHLSREVKGCEAVVQDF